MEFFIHHEDQDALNAKVFDVLLNKIENVPHKSLRSLILNQTLGFAATKEQNELLVSFLKARQLPVKCGDNEFQ